MKRTTTWLATGALLAAGMLAAPSAMAGEIMGVSVSPNPIVDPSKMFTITVAGTGYCDHLVVYWRISEGGMTAKSIVWEKKNFNFSVPPQTQGTVSESGLGASPGAKLVTAEPGPGSKKCGSKVAKTILKVHGKPPLITPPQQRSQGKKPENPATPSSDDGKQGGVSIIDDNKPRGIIDDNTKQMKQ